ncbi:MAG TPA: DNA polymerase [Candidatus Paceibacterota bacterium]
MKTLLLVDANSLIHRAFHALPPLSTSRGEMTNAVYGFVSILLRAIKELDPEYIAAAFDVAGPTKRHKQFAEYKATRKEAPQELYDQFDLVKEVLRALGIPIYEKEGYEADDIIGTIALKVSKQTPGETVIVSGDMDTLQLVNKNTKVYTMRKGMQDTVLFDEGAVEKKFEGLVPGQVADYKGLRGDPSDNIPGVAGVGEKTAIQLLQEFGTIEQLYKNMETTGSVKPALKEKLLSQKKQAFLSKELAIIDTNVPLQWNVQDAAWKSYDKEQLRTLFNRLEFGSLLKRLPGVQEDGAEQRQEKGEHETMEKIERLREEQVLSEEVYKVEQKLVPVLRGMEKTGIKIDRAYFERLGTVMEKTLVVSRKDIQQGAGKEFNVNSTQQLSQVLFGLPPDGMGISSKGLKKTPKGVVSLASPELEKLEGEHPVIKEILAYREIQKLYTTYVKPLPALADATNRIHTSFDQFGAATGRVSSSNPNLQNIPNQGEWGRAIRKGFIAEQGWKLVSFDYSQMELRIAAHITKDPNLVAFFQQGADIHKMTAATVFGVAPEQVTDDMRFRAKALNFGVLYGMGAQGFAKSARISVQEARDFIENYFTQFPRIQQYMEEAKMFALQHGYAQTLMGRKRFLPDMNSRVPQLRSAAERMAINHPIQGTLADITKMAMVEIDSSVSGKGEQWNMLLQIHDELLFEMQDDIIQSIGDRVQGIMARAGGLDVPVAVDVKQGLTWGEMQKLTR